MSKPPRSKRVSEKIRLEYKDPLPIPLSTPLELSPDCQVYSIFTFIHTSLATALLYFQTDRKQSSKPVGILAGNVVWVLKREHIECLWKKGFFGKGILSRSEPNWKQRQVRKLTPFKVREGAGERENLPKQASNQSSSINVTKKRQERQKRYKVNDTEGATWDKSNLPLEMQDSHIEDLEYLQLSPEEAMFLRDIEAIDLIDQDEKPCTIESSWNRLKGKNGDRPDNEFIINYAVYHYYRSRGWVVKNGVKYGTDYVLYRKGPIFHHSEYAVIIVPVDSSGRRLVPTKANWQWLLGVNRVCGQVKKTILLCYVFVPDLNASQLATPRCIRKYQVTEHQIKRWIPERNRD